MQAVYSRNETRFSTRSSGEMRAFRPRSDMAASMSAPSSVLQCLRLGGATGVEWVIETPDGVTAYTVHYGRWVETPEGTATADAVSAWLELGTVAITGATAQELFRVAHETGGDPVSIYVDTFTGTAAGGDVFRFWSRETG